MKKSLILTFSLFLSLNAFAFDSIRMMTLNTWMIPFLRKDASVRAKIIGQEINNYDLVVLQEAFSAKLRKKIVSATDGNFEDSYVPDLPPQINSGLFAFSKFKIINKNFMPFKNCGGVQCASRKGVQHLRLKLPSGQLLDVFNTHLQAFEKDASIRALQLQQASEFIAKINQNDLPAIFAGDFNIISEIAEYSIISGVLLGFSDVWASVNPGDPGYTWDPFTNFYAKEDHDESTLVQRIDYILVRNGKETEWRINRAHLALNSPMPYKKLINETFASDHFAVTTELELHSK